MTSTSESQAATTMTEEELRQTALGLCTDYLQGRGLRDVHADGDRIVATDGGETVTFTVNGTEIHLETKRSTSLSHDTDILVTEKPQSAVSAPFTILKTNGIIEDTEASLSPGAYLFMTEHESIRLDFDERGTYTVYGG